MPNDMEHERRRWAYLTRDQLLTRLRRITDPQKLQNFYRMAVEYGDDDLITAVVGRGDELGINNVVDVRYPPWSHQDPAGSHWATTSAPPWSSQSVPPQIIHGRNARVIVGDVDVGESPDVTVVMPVRKRKPAQKVGSVRVIRIGEAKKKID